VQALYQLKRGHSFDFVEEGRPPGPHVVIVCWGVRYKLNPPTDPWHVMFKDRQGKLYTYALPDDAGATAVIDHTADGMSSAAESPSQTAALNTRSQRRGDYVGAPVARRCSMKIFLATLAPSPHHLNRRCNVRATSFNVRHS
jgi:hypothetical protein